MTALSPHWIQTPFVQDVLAQDNAILALYQLSLPTEKSPNVWQYATQIANGQSIGTQNPQEMERLALYCATPLWVSDPLEEDEGPGQTRFHVILSFPKDILRWDLGMLQTVCFGKVSMMPNLRWLDVALPASVAHDFQGPAWGQAGIRKRCGVPEGRALLMSIFKPCVGVSPEGLARLLYQQAEAGIHLVKDDEVLADANLNSALKRVTPCINALNEAEQAFGYRPLYAVNLNAPAHQLLERAQALLDVGVECFLFNYLAYGLPLFNSLRQQLKGRAFLMGHPALGGAYYQKPSTGMSPALVFGTLPRLAGADAVLFPSPYGTVALNKTDALAVQDALHTPYLDVPPAFGVPSAGIQATMVPQLLRDFGTNVIINAGTGIHDVAGGPVAGVQAFQSAMQAEHSP
jgi:2,3-diketo-5-methylthiopentyl-1-phosphate enolase